MEWKQMQQKLYQKNSKLRGNFKPICYLIQVDEPEFGCEDRSDTAAVKGSALVLTPNGIKTLAIGESRLMRSGFYDEMWTGYLDGMPVLIRKEKIYPARIEDLKWLIDRL